MRRPSVMEFVACFGQAGEDIPVEVKAGLTTIGNFPSIRKMGMTMYPNIADRKITFVTLTREKMTIQVKAI